MAAKVNGLPSLADLLLMAASSGGELLLAPTMLAAAGVGVTMKKYWPELPSGQRPWLTSLVCGPNVTPSMFVPLGANNQMPSPVWLSLKLTCRSGLLVVFWLASPSAQTNRKPPAGTL